LACESLQGKKECELSACGFVARRHSLFEQGMHGGQVKQADRCPGIKRQRDPTPLGSVFHVA
jgi:hypothetical protein